MEHLMLEDLLDWKYSFLRGKLISNCWMRFCDMRSNQDQGKCYQPKLKAVGDIKQLTRP